MESIEQVSRTWRRRKRKVRVWCVSHRVLGEKTGQQVQKEKGNHKTKTKRGGSDGSKPTSHELYLPGQVIFLLSPLKPIEEKFKESLTK